MSSAIKSLAEWSTAPFLCVRTNGEYVSGRETWETPLSYWNPVRTSIGWELTGDEVRFWNDPAGIFPFFVGQANGRVCLSTSLVRAAREIGATELNHEAVAVFLRLGFYLGSDTPLRHIEQLPPESEGRLRDGALRVTSNSGRPAAFAGTRSAAIDGFIELFGQAMRRALDGAGDYVLPLSGGRDSRHILLEAMRQGRPPKSCISGGKPTLYLPWEDSRIAKLLADRVGVPFRQVPVSMGHLETVIDTFKITNFCSDEHDWFLPVASILHEEASPVLDGLAGDVLSAGPFQAQADHELYAKDLPALAETLLDLPSLERKIREGAYRMGLSGELPRRCSFAVARERLIQELTLHRDAVNPLQSFYLWNRTRREVALSPCSILNGLRVICPYLDQDLFAFLWSLPPSFVNDRRFHDDAIRAAYPDFADVPFEAKPTDVVAPFPGWETLWTEIRAYFRAPVPKKLLRPSGARALGALLPLLHGPTGFPLAMALEKLVCLAELDTAANPQA